MIGAGVLTTGAADPASSTSAAARSAAASTPSRTQPLDTTSRTAAREPRVLGARPVVPVGPQDARGASTSRSADRVPLLDTRVPTHDGTRWTTAPLKLRGAPTDRARVRGVLPAVRQVTLTGRHSGPFTEVVTGRTATRWVTTSYLSRTKPKPKPKPKPAPAVARTSAPAAAAPAGLSGAPCPDNSGIEAGLQPAAVKVYRAVCAAFPELTTYGGQDGRGEHVNGQAIDFMVPSSGVGEAVKNFLFAHHAELDLFDIIWSQHIWTIQRASEGFRAMPDRGSPTANHYDHVHIMIN